MPYDGYGGDEGFPHDGKQGRCGYYLDKKIRIQRKQLTTRCIIRLALG